MIRDRLEEGGPYPGEVYWTFEPVGRFEVKYNSRRDRYIIYDDCQSGMPICSGIRMRTCGQISRCRQTKMWTRCIGHD